MIDRDDYETADGYCGSCIRKMKSYERTILAPNEYGDNVCEKCGSEIPSNWPNCPFCGGPRKY